MRDLHSPMRKNSLLEGRTPPPFISSRYTYSYLWEHFTPLFLHVMLNVLYLSWSQGCSNKCSEKFFLKLPWQLSHSAWWNSTIWFLERGFDGHFLQSQRWHSMHKSGRFFYFHFLHDLCTVCICFISHASFDLTLIYVKFSLTAVDEKYCEY